MSREPNPERRPDRSPEAFDEALRRWASRPPRRPAAAAATRVVAQLEQRRHRRAGRWLVVAGVAAVLAAVVSIPGLRPARDGVDTVAGPPAPVVGDGVVVLWIEDDTPLYMWFEPPSAAAAEKGNDS